MDHFLLSVKWQLAWVEPSIFLSSVFRYITLCFLSFLVIYLTVLFLFCLIFQDSTLNTFWISNHSWTKQPSVITNIGPYILRLNHNALFLWIKTKKSVKLPKFSYFTQQPPPPFPMFFCHQPLGYFKTFHFVGSISSFSYKSISYGNLKYLLCLASYKKKPRVKCTHFFYVCMDAQRANENLWLKACLSCI